MQLSFKRELFLSVLPVWLLLVGVLAVSAQAGTPINVGDNKTGEITQAGSTTSYLLTVTTPQAVFVQAFEITAGFAPSFQVIDPSGVVIQSAVNTTGQTAVQATTLLSNAGTYRIDVQSASGQVGQFFFSIQPGPALQPPQPLTTGQPLPGTVSSTTPLQAYSFAASPTDVLLLSVLSDQPASGPTVTIKDADSGETLALSSAKLGGVRYRIPPGTANYLVEVTHSGTTPADSYAICFESENVPSTCSPGTEVSILPTATLPQAAPTLVPTDVPLPTLPTTGDCVVASASGGRINVRSGPSTDFPVSGQLIGLSTAQVMGALPDNSWYEINVSGIYGWVSATVIRFGGDCSTITLITLTPSTSNATATATPTVELTVAPTETATVGPTANGTLHINPISSIVAVGTLTNIDIQPINPKLNYQGAASYGEANLSNGFSPDPYGVGMTTGGNVDVSYLGGSCSGFANTNPDLRINFGGGGASLLRIYFVGSNGDAAIVINDPYGNFYCVDDSFGTVNPTIDFNNPAGGTYDVWVASYAANTTISGTLYLTENSGNHP